MPAPKGRYVPRRGPLAGRTFSSYFHYQQERAHYLGFSSYAEERRLKADPVFQSLEYRMVDVQGIPHLEARRQVQTEMRSWQRQAQALDWDNADIRREPSGRRKHLAIKFAMDEGLYASGDKARDEIPY